MQLREESAVTKRISTTLDERIQRRCERALPEWLKTFDNTVTNGAIMVIDAPTASVLARVGSADFFSTPGGGQVDTCRAPRSPGSALKPFTYALGIERNALYPTEVLLDDSLDYGLYTPENFDQKYRGLVSAGYALRRSLNIPAVTVLERIGVDPMYGFLQEMGLHTLTRDADFYGLGLTLGNCEVRLDELADAYCTLANLGECRPLRYRKDAAPSPPRRLLSRGTCLAVYEMLEQPLPDEFHKDIVDAAGVKSRVCWKTGTSTGYHDAWAIVFNCEYVVAVWLGNNDGRPAKSLVGARAALPLAARLFRSLPRTGRPSWPDAGTNLREVTVCAETGLPASPWCERVARAMIPAGEYLNRVCDVHYPAAEIGEVWPAVIVERWPAAARGWDLARVAANAVPAGSTAKRLTQLTELRIAEPANLAEFILTGEANADRVRARASLDRATTLHWYLDARYLGESGQSKDLFVDLSPGDHRLTCMAPSGATDTVAFKVSLPEAYATFRTR
jgi:penicillin-binding protein 1C